MLIIGSAALQEYWSEREVHDIDVVARKCQINKLYKHYGGTGRKSWRRQQTCSFSTDSGKRVEVHLLSRNPAWQYLFKQLGCDDDNLYKAPLSVLFSVKKSHINFPQRFDKHIVDYVWLGEKVGWVDSYPEFTKLNTKSVAERNVASNYSFPTFFHQSSISKIMAPISPKGWKDYSVESKCVCVLGRAYVIALQERIIPFLFAHYPFYTSGEALKWAMMKICTTKGVMRDFATQHYFDILRYADLYYDYKFLKAFEDGRIKCIN